MLDLRTRRVLLNSSGLYEEIDVYQGLLLVPKLQLFIEFRSLHRSF